MKRRRGKFREYHVSDHLELGQSVQLPIIVALVHVLRMALQREATLHTVICILWFD